MRTDDKIPLYDDETVNMPSLPNFLNRDGLSMPVRMFNQKELQKIGRAWTKALMQKGKRDCERFKRENTTAQQATEREK